MKKRAPRLPADEFPPLVPRIRFLLTHNVDVATIAEKFQVSKRYVYKHKEYLDNKTKNSTGGGMYWDDRVKSAVKLYVSLDPTDHADIRSVIYTQHIHPAMRKLAEININVHSKISTHNESMQSLIDTIVGEVWQHLDTYDPSRATNSFSYFNTCVRNSVIINWHRQGMHLRERERQVRRQNLIESLDVSLDPDNHGDLRGTSRLANEVDETLRSRQAGPEAAKAAAITMDTFIQDTLRSPNPPGSHRMNKSKIRSLKQALLLFDADKFDVDPADEHRSSRTLITKQWKDMIADEFEHVESWNNSLTNDIRMLYKAWKEQRAEQ